METQKIVNGLKQLGFNTGWVVTGEEITLWINSLPQPSREAILEASKNYVEPVPTIEQKLEALGITADELKTLLS